MRPRPWNRRTAVGVGLFAVAFAACTEEQPTGVNAGPVQNATIPCQEECVIIEDTRPLRAALARFADPDSVVTDVFLADFTMRGMPGSTVRAVLDVSDDVLAGISSLRIRITVGDTDRLYTLRELHGGLSLLRFDGRSEVTVKYALPRRLLAVPDGSLRLIQQAEAVEVRAARTPWVTSRTTPSVASSVIDPDCVETVPSPGTYCDATVTVDIVPFHTGGPFGGFQSAPGTGASSTITVDFSIPITSVRVTVQDPTFEGNAMTASGPGFSNSISFAGSGTPGVNRQQTGSLSGNITTVQLIPASADYVAYTDFIITVGGLPQTLELQCMPSPSLVRGDSIVCTARAPGAFTFEVTGWTFNGTQQNFQQAPRNHPIDRQNVMPTDTMWAGPMAIGGEVSVFANVNDSAQTASAMIMVDPRDWSMEPFDSTMVRELEPGVDPEYQLPAVPRSFAGQFGRAAVWSDFVSGWEVDRVIMVLDGPNEGMQFLSTLPVEMAAHIQINRTAMADSSVFWFQQPDPPNPSGPGSCSRQFLTTTFLNAVIAHEGLGFAPNSHMTIYREEFRNQAVDALEAATGTEDIELITNVVEIVNEAHRIAGDSTAAIDDTTIAHPRNNLNAIVNCEFQY